MRIFRLLRKDRADALRLASVWISGAIAQPPLRCGVLPISLCGKVTYCTITEVIEPTVRYCSVRAPGTRPSGKHRDTLKARWVSEERGAPGVPARAPIGRMPAPDTASK